MAETFAVSQQTRPISNKGGDDLGIPVFWTLWRGGVELFEKAKVCGNKAADAVNGDANHRQNCHQQIPHQFGA